MALEVKNLSVSIEQKPILNNLTLTIPRGQLHVLMGPNGSGKSTLAATLMGHPACEITGGRVMLDDVNITELTPDKRSKLGLFLAFQHPYEIPGVTVFTFLKEAYAAHTKDPAVFKNLLEQNLTMLGLDMSFAYRPLNYGFSGGEKKKLELLQLLMLQPRMAIVDEIDSGLDVDAIALVAQCLQKIRASNPGMSFLLITHYPRLLSYVSPDVVHVMHQGSLVTSGPAALAHTIEARGYDAVL